MRFFACLLVGWFLTSTTSVETITISAAISHTESLTEIARVYQTNTGNQILFNFDASGKLVAQIMQGAPVDGFISADDEQMDKLAATGKVNTASRRVIVDNALVLIAARDEKHPPQGFSDLLNNRGKKIAIGEPKSVPAGHYAMQTLKALKLDQAITPQLVMGESVRQVLTYVKQDEAWAGIVYATDARQAGEAVKVIAEADPTTHDKIEYPGAVITGSPHAAMAEKFLDYLLTDPAKTIFIAHGFVIPTLVPTTRPGP